jgi:hypothetical protein
MNAVSDFLSHVLEVASPFLSAFGGMTGWRVGQKAKRWWLKTPLLFVCAQAGAVSVRSAPKICACVKKCHAFD